jgi:hypothetical protein
VNLLSTGYMCAKGWRMKRYNPAGTKIKVFEMPHEPDRFSPRGGPNTGMFFFAPLPTFSPTIYDRRLTWYRWSRGYPRPCLTQRPPPPCRWRQRRFNRRDFRLQNPRVCGSCTNLWRWISQTGSLTTVLNNCPFLCFSFWHTYICTSF